MLQWNDDGKPVSRHFYPSLGISNKMTSFFAPYNPFYCGIHKTRASFFL